MDLIPTTHRGRLGKGLSHPLGAELVSEALSGVPQWSELDLRFNSEPKSGIGLFTPGRGIHYLRGNAGRELLSFTEVLYCGFWDPGFWTIGTFPVASTEREWIRLVLLDGALPKMRAWLSKDRPEPWMQPQRVIQFGLDKGFSELGILETNNDRVVSVERVSTLPRREPPNKPMQTDRPSAGR